MHKKIILILFILNGDVICAMSEADSWTLFSKTLKDSFSNCPANLGIFDCLRHSSLEVFDKMTMSDVIPLTLDARLQRYRPGRSLLLDSGISRHSTHSVNGIHSHVGKRNDTFLTKESWSEHVLKRINDLFKTHTLSIDLIPESSSSRARHRNRNQMLPMMIFGVTALGTAMGFQFLSVLGGKALLLAKMALMLAMMNGFKKVANSGVHYGLYHSEPHHHGYHYLDRGDINRPRSTEM